MINLIEILSLLIQKFNYKYQKKIILNSHIHNSHIFFI